MTEKKIWQYRLGEILAVYSTVNGTMQFTLVPVSVEKKILEEKLTLEGRKYNAPDGAVQAHVFGDRLNRQYSAGQTMRNSESSFALKFKEQTKTEENGTVEILSRLVRADGQEAEHHVVFRSFAPRFIECFTVYKNGSQKPVTLEMLSSFSVGSLTPFRMDNGAGRIEIYRMRSQWSSEARLEKMDSSALVLEPSWMNYGARGERFGSVGSMPAKKFMPFIGLTDKKAGVTWAAALGYAGSWQMEFYMSQDSINLSGGVADFEFGHWRKKLAVGESLETPHAYLTCVRGDIDRAAQYLTEVQLLSSSPKCEAEMPVLYNEYCRNWGGCRWENLRPLIDRTAELGAKYFVIDAGWSFCEFGKTGRKWTVKKEFYPDGIDGVVKYIHSKGMKAGIWFEPESFEWEREADEGLPLVRREGMVVRNLERVFADLTSAAVRESLDKGVTEFLKKNGFDYVKFDYNENIGVGCDGAESLGEGLRRQIFAAYDFYRSVKTAMPELVVEMCSSGGMRCEPSMIALGDMMSFSDIHETPDEAVVACDIQRVLHPSKSQIWATLHDSDGEDKLIYTLSCGFYGRLCLSGYIDRLNDHQMSVVRRALEIYRDAAPIIRRGFTRFIGKTPPQRHLKGYKGCIRRSEDGKSALIVAHIFDESAENLRVADSCLDGMEIKSVFAPADVKISLREGVLYASGLRKMTAFVAVVERKKPLNT